MDNLTSGIIRFGEAFISFVTNVLTGDKFNKIMDSIGNFIGLLSILFKIIDIGMSVVARLGIQWTLVLFTLFQFVATVSKLIFFLGGKEGLFSIFSGLGKILPGVSRLFGGLSRVVGKFLLPLTAVITAIQ